MRYDNESREHGPLRMKTPGDLGKDCPSKPRIAAHLPTPHSPKRVCCTRPPSTFTDADATTNRTEIYNDSVTSTLGAASYQIAAGPGSYSDTYTVSGGGSADWSMIMAAFRPAALGTGGHLLACGLTAYRPHSTVLSLRFNSSVCSKLRSKWFLRTFPPPETPFYVFGPSRRIDSLPL